MDIISLLNFLDMTTPAFLKASLLRVGNEKLYIKIPLYNIYIILLIFKKSIYFYKKTTYLFFYYFML